MSEDDPFMGRGVTDINFLRDLMAQIAQDQMGGVEEEEEWDPSIKCPICSKKHEEKKVVTSSSDVKHHCSHGAMMVFLPMECPICMDTCDPPVVALNCGHAICVKDFEKIGGRTGEAASQIPEAPPPRQRIRTAPLGQEMLDRFQQAIIQEAMEGNESDDDPPPAMDDDESSHESMPPLLPREDNNNDDSDSEDDSLPPLLTRQANEDSTDSDDDSLPALLPRQNVDDSSDSDDDLLLVLVRSELDEDV